MGSSSGGLLGWGLCGRVEALDCTGHMVDLRPGELRENGQRQYLASGTLRLGQLAGPVGQVREALLQVQRNRVIDLCPDTCRRQVLPQLIAAVRADHVLVPDVPPTCDRDGRNDGPGSRACLQPLRVLPGMRVSCVAPFVEV